MKPSFKLTRPQRGSDSVMCFGLGIWLVCGCFTTFGLAQEGQQGVTSRVGPQSRTEPSQSTESQVPLNPALGSSSSPQVNLPAGVQAQAGGAENEIVQGSGKAPERPTVASLTETTNGQMSDVSSDDEQASLKREKLAAIQERLKLLAQFRSWNSTQAGVADDLLARVDENLAANVAFFDYDEGQVALDRANKLLVELRLALKDASAKQEAKAGLETQIQDAQASLEVNRETVPNGLAEIATLEQQVSEQLLQELLVFQENTSVEVLRNRTQKLEEGVSKISARVEALKKQLAQEQIGRIHVERAKVAKVLGELPDGFVKTRIQEWFELKVANATEEDTEEAFSWFNLSAKHDRILSSMKKASALKSRWTSASEAMHERLNSAKGGNRWVVQRLRRERAELPNVAELSAELRAFEADEQQAESLEYDIEEVQERLSDLIVVGEIESAAAGEPQAEPSQDGTESSQEPSSGSSQAKGINQDQAGVLRASLSLMKSDISRYLVDLYEVADAKEDTIEVANNYRSFIDKQLFWTPSSKPASTETLANAAPAARWLLDLQQWKAAGALLYRDAQGSRLFWWVGFAVAIGWLVVRRSSLIDELHSCSRLASRKTCVEYQPSVRALIATLLIAIPVSFALLFIGWRLYVGCERERIAGFPLALSSGMFAATQTLFPMSLLRQLCRPQGLGIKHFEWRESQTLILHRSLRWLIDFSVPLVVTIGMLLAHSEEAWEQSLGRLAFLAFMGLLSVFFGITLHPARGIFSGYLASRRGGWVDQLRYVWYPLLVAIPVSLGVLSLWGYHYTSLQLAGKIDETLWMVVILTVLYCLLKRWFVIRRRALMMEQARQRLLDASSKAAEEEHAVPVEDALDLVVMNDQTKRLVTSFFVTVGLGLAFWIWAGVLPAIDSLEEFVFWDVEGSEGKVVSITLSDVLLVIPVVVLTVIATRNVPGLLEIAFLQHLPISNAARYAVTTIARYALVALGIVIACRLVGLRWTSVQWLVAALGVGLGFGLQEIFANFISGIILLFEQPIRVGDVVTIDGTTGTVAKIRMRATTVVNWDRQELIVPNKELITGKLINWTLSDTTNRVVINVGVAYGSNAEQACEIVRRVCREHPNIMEDPGPIVTFEGFGDNTLNLVARAYLDSLDNRLSTVHELHETIYRSLNEAEIEIAFPQRDLHIRSVPDSLKSLLATKPS